MQSETHAIHTVDITLPDGSTATHTAEALGYRHMADGSIAVLAACCGMVGGKLCDECNGVGCPACAHRGVTGHIICPTCNGSRVVPAASIAAPTPAPGGATPVLAAGMPMAIAAPGSLIPAEALAGATVPCPNCNGQGEIRTEDTRSWHTFYDIGMPVSDGKGGFLPQTNPVIEVFKHVQNVAERHAARHKAKASSLDWLMKPRAPKTPSP